MRRPDLLHVGRHRVDALGVVDHHAGVEHAVVADHPLEDVGQRQEREALVALAVKLKSSTQVVTFEAMLPWVSITPLGSPVVPEV